MITIIPDLLNPNQLDAIQSVLGEGQFVDGKLSTGSQARNQKNNEELDSNSDTFSALNDVVMTSLLQHPDYLHSAFPARIAAPLYARYRSGMGYGRHLDDPIMGPANARFRSDISITVFLNSPEDYQGGELCIEESGGLQSYKLAAGSALLYSSTSIHSVTPVTSGERLVAVTWLQSMIRQDDQREVLYHLHQAMRQAKSNEPELSRENIDLSYQNLIRMWAHT